VSEGLAGQLLDARRSGVGLQEIDSPPREQYEGNSERNSGRPHDDATVGPHPLGVDDAAGGRGRAEDGGQTAKDDDDLRQQRDDRRSDASLGSDGEQFGTERDDRAASGEGKPDGNW